MAPAGVFLGGREMKMPDYFPEMLWDYLHKHTDQELFDTLMNEGFIACWKIWEESRNRVEADQTNPLDT